MPVRQVLGGCPCSLAVVMGYDDPLATWLAGDYITQSLIDAELGYLALVNRPLDDEINYHPDIVGEVEYIYIEGRYNSAISDQNKKTAVLGTITVATLVLPGPEDLVVGAVLMTKAGRYIGQVVQKAGEKFVRLYDGTLARAGERIDVPKGTADDFVDLSSGCKGAWCGDLNKPKPNTNYKVDDNYAFSTDGLGRTNKVEGDLNLNTKDRNTYQQCKAGNCGNTDDEGGHLIASIFNGPGEKINLVPMNGNLNKGEWKKLENTWAGALNEGKSVKVTVEPVYSGNSVRPDSFSIGYSVDGGRIIRKTFLNTPGGN